MVKRAEAQHRHRIWVAGQEYQFQVATSTIALWDATYEGNAANPTRRQKRQIVLHCTTGYSSAEALLQNWFNSPTNADHVSSHYIIEQAYHANSVARPAPPAGVLPDHPGTVDALLIAPGDDTVTHHAGGYNRASIGLEITNIGSDWWKQERNQQGEPSYQGGPHARHHCPDSGADQGHWCVHGRPDDLNRYYRMAAGAPYDGDHQAFDEEQYRTLTFLLRYLCIRWRIPRRFIGVTTAEALRRYIEEPAGNTPAQRARRRANNSVIYHFSGIIFHRNVTGSGKRCPGPLHRNRLYRGVIDEWWLPVEAGAPRAYYSGPWRVPPWRAGTPTRPALFRGIAGGRMEATVFRDADLDGLLETRSYFNLADVESYYRRVETREGGLFPIGTNKVWHGGVHFPVADDSPFVYAAASGTIVAARLSSNPETDGHPKFGSQRFVLIRHAVYLDVDADPQGGVRIRYSLDGTVQPRLVFSLYMHLDPVRDPANEHDENPPWFNAWRRAHAGDDIGLQGGKGRVFAPNVEVSVGDILGTCGRFRGRRLVHFEVFSHGDVELTMAPWNDPRKRFVDADDNAVCDVGALNRFVQDSSGDGIDVADILRGAAQLRDVKARHLSEWALAREAQIEPVVPHPRLRRALWAHFARFSWVADAVNANPTLRDQLGANGFFWHYHPIALMQKVNSLIAQENREVPEEADHDANVIVDDEGYIARFVDWNAAANRFADARADNDRVHVAVVSANNQRFDFQRRDIACLETIRLAAAPAQVPTSTKFSLALLEALQHIRKHYNADVDVRRSHVANDHLGNAALCCATDAAAVGRHGDGIAVDFRPGALNPANCSSLWNSARWVLETFNNPRQDACGTPSEAGLPAPYNRIEFRAHPADAQARLEAAPQQALSAAQAAAFCIHMELVERRAPAPAADARPLPVRLRVTFQTLEVLDDQDWFGSGEWRLSAWINGQPFKTLNQDVDTGAVIPLRGWVKELELRPDDALEIRVSGTDEDVFSDDSLGSASARFTRRSDPAWGLGGARTLTSSNGSFRISLTIESLNVEY
jgi:N-acetyl-anhydromuramyl-L-alanine amidase AmpD